MSYGKGSDFSGLILGGRARTRIDVAATSNPRESFTENFPEEAAEQTGSFLWECSLHAEAAMASGMLRKASCVNGSFHRKRRRADVSLARFTCHTPELFTRKSPNPHSSSVPILPVRQLRHRLSNSPQGPQLGSGTEGKAAHSHFQRMCPEHTRVQDSKEGASEQTVHTPPPSPPFTL